MGESFCLTVNGVERYISEDKPLLRYPRNDLHPHSAKGGRSEGACGTCTTVVDGKVVKPCVLTTRRAVSKNITATEGLSGAEKEAFIYTFRAVESVQCGLCTPGMVMAGGALIDHVPDPIEEEIKVMLRGNICRCIGYKRTIEDIQLTAAILRDDARIGESLEKGDEYGAGKRAFRLDMREKVLGYGEYPDDVEMERVVYASTVHSQYPWVRVLDIDCGKTAALPDALTVLTVEDVPNNKVGHLRQDWDIMIAKGGITRCAGDIIRLVVVESRDIFEKAKRMVKTGYKELKPVYSIQEAMTEDAPRVHEKGNLCQSRHVTRGNAKKALENSRYVMIQTHRTLFTERIFLEPEYTVALLYKDGVKVYSTGQGVYDTRKEIPIMLGQDPDRVVVEDRLIGGGLGGREDVSVQHIAVLAALKMQRPVEVAFSGQESLSFHPKRHAMEGTFILGCDENGIFIGLGCEIYSDTGVYVSLCGSVLEGACAHSVGPCCYQNTGIRGFGYYTNNPLAGASRGFGVCQSEFVLESSINLLAEKVGILPWEVRYRDAIEPGKVLPSGQIANCSTASRETLLAVRDAYESNPGRTGIAYIMKNADVGVGLPDKGRVKLAVHNEKIELYGAALDIGQGCAVVFVRMVSGATGFGKETARNMRASSEVAPDSGTTSGFRQTLITGEAVRVAVADLNEVLQGVRGDLSRLEGRKLSVEFFDPTNKLGANVSNPKSRAIYGFATHVVVLDDDGRAKEVYAAHDFGKIVSPISVQGQIEGGVPMGLDYVLTENSPLKNDVSQAKYGTLGLTRSTQTLDVHTVYVEKEGLLSFTYDAKGIGEIATIPTTPVTQGAYCAKDHVLRTTLPMDGAYYSKKK